MTFQFLCIDEQYEEIEKLHVYLYCLFGMIFPVNFKSHSATKKYKWLNQLLKWLPRLIDWVHDWLKPDSDLRFFDTISVFRTFHSLSGWMWQGKFVKATVDVFVSRGAHTAKLRPCGFVTGWHFKIVCIIHVASWFSLACEITLPTFNVLAYGLKERSQ